MTGFDLKTVIKLEKKKKNLVNNIGGVVQGVADFTLNGQLPNFGGQGRFNLNRFKSEFVRLDPALTSHFFVTIPAGGKQSSLVSFSCAGADLPGVTFNTTEARRYGVGPTYSYPTSNVLTDVQFSFMCDSTGIIQDYFHQWMNRIFEYNLDADLPYTSAYLRDYATTLTIELFNRKKNVYYTFELVDAYPFAVGNAQLSWEGSTLMRLPVSFKFKTYKFKMESAEPGKDGFLSSVNVPGIGQVRDLLRLPQQIRDIQNQVNRTSDILGSIGGNFDNFVSHIGDI